MGNKGFTLVELLVVITIIGILGVVGVNLYNEPIKKAKESKVLQDLQVMAKQIEVAREARGLHFYQLTGKDYSDEKCRNPNTAFYPAGTKIKDRPGCISDIQSSWNNFTNAPLPFDPWGSIYMFDENELETNFYWPPIPGNPKYYCRWDILKSAGSDQLSWTNDDYIYYVRPRTCSTKEELYCTPGKVLGGNRSYFPCP